MAADFFAQAHLKDEVTARHDLHSAVRRAVVYLQHRFPGRLRVRWIDPWSLSGLWFCWRHRVRHIPCLVLPDGRQVDLRNPNLTSLRDLTAAYLAGDFSPKE